MTHQVSIKLYSLTFFTACLIIFTFYPTVVKNRISLAVLQRLSNTPFDGVVTYQEYKQYVNCPSSFVPAKTQLQLRQQLICLETSPDLSNLLPDQMDQFNRWYWGHSLYYNGQVADALQKWKTVANSDIAFANKASSIYFRSSRTQSDIDNVKLYLELSEQVDNRIIYKKGESYYAGYLVFRDGIHENNQREYIYAENYVAVQPSLLSHLIFARVLISNQEYEKALEVLEKGQSYSEEPYNRINYETGRAWRGMGNYENARVHLEMISKESTNYPNARLELLHVHFGSGNIESAKLELLHIMSLDDPTITNAAKQLQLEFMKHENNN